MTGREGYLSIVMLSSAPGEYRSTQGVDGYPFGTSFSTRPCALSVTT